jgi:hypothetical protein
MMEKMSLRFCWTVMRPSTHSCRIAETVFLVRFSDGLPPPSSL